MGGDVIFSSILKALGQITDPRFRGTVLLGVALALALLIGAAVAVTALLRAWFGDSITLPWIGEIVWLGDVVAWSGGAAVLGLSVFLMIPVASAFTSMFLERVAQAVEDVHYPHLPPAQPVSLAEGIADTVSFLGILIVANLCALILYLFFLPLAPLIFLALNGLLLGREYFTLAAMRRVGRAGAKLLRRKHAAAIWAAGVLMAIPLTVPLLNLVVPVIGAATFTHLFHAVYRSSSTPS